MRWLVVEPLGTQTGLCPRAVPCFSSSRNFSFAASGDSIIPGLKPIDLMLERKMMQGCLALVFAPAHVVSHQPWDSYIFPPEIAELVFLDAKACAGDVKAATSLKDKSELARKFSHYVTLRFLQSSGAAFTVLPSTPQVFDAADIAYIDVEIRGMPSVTVNVFAIEYASRVDAVRTRQSGSFCDAGMRITARQEALLWTPPSRYNPLP